jgi:metal-responsive CopG/Arc/MetJ family transcriptional regulator
MRTSKTISVSLPASQLKEMEKVARRENRTLSGLVRELFRRYQQQENDRVLVADPARARMLLDLMRAVEELRKEAGAQGLTTRQINAEIAAYRRERARKSRQPAA